MNQLKFFRVLGTALTLAIIGACSSSDSDDATSAPPVTIPEVTINTLVELTGSNKAAFPLTGSCSENTRAVVVSANTTITPLTQPTCQSNGWTTSLNLSTLTGNITISAHQVDGAGNTGNAPVKSIIVERQTFLHSQIAAGSHHACALTSEGGVKCWGRQASGRLGNNNANSANILYPTNVVGLDTDGTPRRRWCLE